MADIDNYINTIKNAVDGDTVRDAIIGCMNEINKDSAFVVKSYAINKKLSNANGTYRAPSGEVWKDVTLNITNDDGSEVPTTTQAYDITINNDTENKVWNAEEEHGKGARWGNITVDLDWSRGSETIADNVVISTDDLDDEGTWHAEVWAGDGSISATRSLTFSNVDPVKSKGGYIGEGGQTMYPITFKDYDGTTLGKKDYASGTHYDWTDSNGNHPSRPGYTFSGWSGTGIADREQTVYAQYTNPSLVIGEIADDWSVIVSKERSGSGYPLGSYKSISIAIENMPYSKDKAQFRDAPDSIIPTTGTYRYIVDLVMIKVGIAEEGTHSSWLSAIPKAMDNALIPGHIRSYDDWWRNQHGISRLQYDQSRKMVWLNSVFLDSILPADISKYVLQVNKHFKWRSQAQTLANQTIAQRIWLPSMREVWIEGWDDNAEVSNMSQQDIDLIKPLFFDGAIGQDYFNSNLQLTTAEERYNIFNLITGNQWGSNNSLRDTSEGTYQGHQFPFIAQRTVDNANQAIIGGYTASNVHEICPAVFGFCL